MKTQLADRIRKARYAAGLSQSKAADLLLVHRGTFGHWERGAGHEPTSANLMLLAQLLDVSYEWLATGRGSMQMVAEEVSAVRLDFFARSNEEEQLLLALRKLPESRHPAVVAFALSLAHQPSAQVTRLMTKAPTTASLHPAMGYPKKLPSGASR